MLILLLLLTQKQGQRRSSVVVDQKLYTEHVCFASRSSVVGFVSRISGAATVTLFSTFRRVLPRAAQPCIRLAMRRDTIAYSKCHNNAEAARPRRSRCLHRRYFYPPACVPVSARAVCNTVSPRVESASDGPAVTAKMEVSATAAERPLAD